MKKKIWLPEHMLAYIASEAHKKGVLVEHMILDMIGEVEIQKISNDDLVLLLRDKMNGDKHDGYLTIDCDEQIIYLNDEGE
jgi:hypothetical protein